MWVLIFLEFESWVWCLRWLLRGFQVFSFWIWLWFRPPWTVGEVFGCWESGWKVGEMFGSRWFFFGVWSCFRPPCIVVEVFGWWENGWKVEEKKNWGFFLINLIFCLFKFIKWNLVFCFYLNFLLRWLSVIF